MKLKTVEDLETECTCALCGRLMVGMEELKEEAIKWYKKTHTLFDENSDWLKFFNITKDEL